MTNAGDKDKCRGMIYCGEDEQQMVMTVAEELRCRGGFGGGAFVGGIFVGVVLVEGMFV